MITGQIAAEISTRSKLQCSDRCSSDAECKAYRYKGTGPGNCLLIHSNSTAAQGQIFEGDDSSVIYVKDKSQVTSTPPCQAVSATSETWTPPGGWNGPFASLYQSFDSAGCLILMKGTQKMNALQLVSGQVNNALILDGTKWVDLGIHRDVCLTRPETCGEAGGAISLWIKVIQCSDTGGIVSSKAQAQSSGFLIVCFPSGGLSVQFHARSGWFRVATNFYTEWTHVVVSYIGPNQSQGFKFFFNGRKVGSAPYFSEENSAGDGRIVVGRQFTDVDADYSNIHIDELIFFNETLNNDQVALLSNHGT